MYQLTQEFIEEYLGNRYEALFAVHVDKGHLHSHIVFNSVSMIDGYKYQYTKVYRFQSKAARRYHDLKRMKELQEQYLYLVNHKIESADEMLDCHAQIKEKIADISAEQKMIYAENRKLGKLTEDEAETIRQKNTERLEVLKSRKKERKDAEYKKKLDELFAKFYADEHKAGGKATGIL